MQFFLFAPVVLFVATASASPNGINSTGQGLNYTVNGCPITCTCDFSYFFVFHANNYNSRLLDCLAALGPAAINCAKAIAKEGTGM